jgi:hypothetical protein
VVAIDFTVGEQDALSSLLAEASERAKHPVTLELLLERWTNFVTAVEGGYADSIYEYTNDLATRDLIERIARAAPETVGRKIDAAVAPIDERFLAVTRVASRPVPGGGNERWSARIPNVPGSELAEDLRAEGCA